MNIYDIDRRIEEIYASSVDPETGETTPEAIEELNSLNMERDEKIENVALWYKNTTAEAKAIAEEIKRLQDRKKALESKAEWQKEYLENALQGSKFETPKVAVSYRRSERVEIYDELAFTRKYAGDGYLVDTTVKYTPNKANIKNCIKAGQTLEGARLEESNNIQIK